MPLSCHTASLGLAALLVLPTAGVAPAGPRMPAAHPVFRPPVVLIDAGQADAMVARLRLYIGFCQQAKAAYRVDCLAERFAAAGRAMDPYGGLPEMRTALMAASQSLGAVARKYQSPTMAAVVLHATGAETITSTRPILPVDPAKQGVANKAALAVVQDTQLTLLRSADSSASDALAFQQVAAVLDGAKVLLRSG